MDFNEANDLLNRLDGETSNENYVILEGKFLDGLSNGFGAGAGIAIGTISAITNIALGILGMGVAGVYAIGPSVAMGARKVAEVIGSIKDKKDRKAVIKAAEESFKEFQKKDKDLYDDLQKRKEDLKQAETMPGLKGTRGIPRKDLEKRLRKEIRVKKSDVIAMKRLFVKKINALDLKYETTSQIKSLFGISNSMREQ